MVLRLVLIIGSLSVLIEAEVEQVLFLRLAFLPGIPDMAECGL